MIKYLDYVLANHLAANDFELPEFFLEEFDMYKQYWQMYSFDNSYSSLYKPTIPPQINTHIIHLLPTECISISWDVNDIYERTIPSVPITEISLIQFDLLTLKDRTNSVDVFKHLEKEVKSIHKHAYEPILIMNLTPTNDVIFLDGRHRYVEHKKFHPDKLLHIYALHDERCAQSIVYKKDFLAYAILHNIYVMQNHFDSGCLSDDFSFFENMIDIKKYID